ncbi:MAG: NADH-ubiquinone oxidoreductase-F iron-sulfur binding region domain-containing protein [Actinomycetes bacterium]
MPTERTRALTEPVSSLQDYLDSGGGQGLAAARKGTPESVIDALEAAGLRGRGGAGFPTAVKWRTIRSAGSPTTYVVCNAAEGEPGTFKDRMILRNNPYQVLEGMAIAAEVTGAARAFLVIKRAFEREIATVQTALDEMRGADQLGAVPLSLVLGPDHYLLGEEKATVEVVEGGEPLPRVFPPYQVGLFARAGAANPTAMNNVETLAHVAGIMRYGSDWFRSCGTDTSPGTTVFTLSGDVDRPGVTEQPMGLTMRALVDDIGGGAAHGQVKAVIPGASGALLTSAQLDTRLDFDSMRAIGSGLGSAGFVVYDDSACIVAAVLVFARFLAIESCGQCPACKQGTLAIAETLAKIERGEGSEPDLATLRSKCGTVTGGQRCALPTGATQLVRSALEAFPEEIEAHLGHPCPLPRSLPTPKIVDFDETGRRFTYDERYQHKQPDWTYAERPDEEWSA